MMPGTDGLEFCKQLKTNFQTSHIPVILLTAKVTQENKIEGLENGADDYVLKPFNFKELSLRIKNLLEQRKLLKEKFSKEIYIQPGAVTVNPLDKEFLEKSLKVVESNLYNAQFDLETFAKEMFLSRSQLHRKMIGITGQAPGEFIRVFRLKKAAQLLLEKKLSVTQIALEIGFNSPSHFTKAFQQYFNCLPSEFAVQNNSK
jgi:DNA-binding response OmpR family regulator